MKKLISCIVLGVGLLAIPNGCALFEDRPPVAKAFLSFKTVQNGVSKALELYGIKHAQGKVSDEKRAKIKEAYTNYQASFNVAIELARFNYSTAASEDVIRLANELTSLIYNL